MGLKSFFAVVCSLAIAAGSLCAQENIKFDDFDNIEEITIKEPVKYRGIGKFVHTDSLVARYAPGRRPYFGVRASLGYSYPYNVKYARIPLAAKATGPDISIAGLFHVPLGNLWYVEPQLEAYYSMLTTDSRICEEPAGEGITTAKLNTVGFRVPIYWGARLDIFDRVETTIFTGPQFDFRIHTAFKPDAETDIFNGTTARPLYGDYGVDLDLRSGVGFSIGHIFFGATFSWGLAHVTRSDYGAKRQRTVQATVGYDF